MAKKELEDQRINKGGPAEDAATRAYQEAVQSRDAAKISKARQNLPPSMEILVNVEDRDESFKNNLWDGTTKQTTETNWRYAAYTQRIRTILVSAQRYVAYTSDIGESFRPIAHPGLVRAAYGVSWAYLIVDVSHEGYKAFCRNQHVRAPQTPRMTNEHRYTDGTGEYPNPVLDESGNLIRPQAVPPLEDFRSVMAQRAIFQGVASMGLPAFTIHSIVKYSGRYLKNKPNLKISTKIRAYGPIGLGLAAVPALPFMFDEPVEKAVEWAFHKGFELYGGKAAVGNSPATGREVLLAKENKMSK